MADFLRRKCHLVLFHWRNNTKIALYPLGVVIVNVIPNHPNKLLLGSESLTVISLALQDAPESLHWAIVNAVSHARHTLRHTGFLQHMVKGSVGVLKTTVTVEQWMCIRIGFHCSLECVKHNRIVVVVTNNIRNDTSVVQVKDGTQIDFVNYYALVLFELCNIGKPLHIWSWCMEITTEYILCHILRIGRIAGTAVVAILNG